MLIQSLNPSNLLIHLLQYPLLTSNSLAYFVFWHQLELIILVSFKRIHENHNGWIIPEQDESCFSIGILH